VYLRRVIRNKDADITYLENQLKDAHDEILRLTEDRGHKGRELDMIKDSRGWKYLQAFRTRIHPPKG
jgi:hypothetical protein